MLPNHKGAAAQVGAPPPSVSAPGLVRALEGLLTAELLETETNLAPICVRTLSSLMRLLLRCPELMPQGSWEEDEEGEDDQEIELPPAEEAEEYEDEAGEEASEIEGEEAQCAVAGVVGEAATVPASTAVPTAERRVTSDQEER